MESILNKVSKADIVSHPFPHIVIHNALSDDLYRKLEAEYPSTDLLTLGQEKKNNARYQISAHVNFFDMETIVDLVEKAKFKVTQQNEINQISLFPLIYEAFDFSGFWGKLTYKMLMRSRYKNNYYLTCLVVGEKTI